MKAAWFDALVFDLRFGGQNCLSVAQALQAELVNLMAVRQNLHIQIGVCWLQCLIELAFFLRLPTGQYGPVSQLSRSEERCTGPFNWGEAHCAGEKVKRKIGPFQWKSL